MEVSERLPTVKDFRLYGKFHSLPEIDPSSDVPLIILIHIFPNYLFMKENLSPETLYLIKTHCILTKQQAQWEDNIEKLKDQKELQIRRLEDKIHSFYLNKKIHCKCKENTH